MSEPYRPPQFDSLKATKPVTHAVAQSFSSMLPDVETLRVVSKLRSPAARNHEEELEVLRTQAQENGYREGFRAGEVAGKSEGYQAGILQGTRKAEEEFRTANSQAIDAFTQELSATLARVNDELPQWFKRAESAMTARTMNILRRLLSAELELTREHALSIVHEALSEVNHARKVRIRLNPFDRMFVAKHRDELIAAAQQVQDIEFVDDPSIEGGCVIESEGGTIDARLDLRLELVEQDLAS